MGWGAKEEIAGSGGIGKGKSSGEIPNVDEGVMDTANHHDTCIPM